MNNNILLLAALACAPLAVKAQTDSAPGPAHFSPDAKPDVGTKAPEFRPTSWIQGEPVTGWEKGKVYLIECWATWCGPCIAQIPHLTELHKKYGDKGLVVIGTNVRDKDANNAAAFVNKQGDKMPYRVAYDANNGGLVTRDWLEAADAEGIPYAFVVRDGIIQWLGHPGSLTDAKIESILAGTFDITKEKKKMDQEELQEKKWRDRNTAYAKMIVGNKVPEFKPDTWLGGAPVSAWEKGKVYLIKFSNTLLDTSARGLDEVPVLADFHNKYDAKGLVVVEVNMDKDAANAAAWVKKQGAKVPYRFAFAAEDGFVRNHWIDNSYPQTYAVRDGILIWHGTNVRSLEDTAVESMLAGTFDVGNTEKKRKQLEALRIKIRLLERKGMPDEAMKAVDELRELLPKKDKVDAELYRAEILGRNGDKPGALATLKNSAESNPTNPNAQYFVVRAIWFELKGVDGAPTLLLDCIGRMIAAEPAFADVAEIKGLREAATKAAKTGKFAE